MIACWISRKCFDHLQFNTIGSTHGKFSVCAATEAFQGKIRALKYLLLVVSSRTSTILKENTQSFTISSILVEIFYWQKYEEKNTLLAVTIRVLCYRKKGN